MSNYFKIYYRLQIPIEYTFSNLTDSDGAFLAPVGEIVVS